MAVPVQPNLKKRSIPLAVLLFLISSSCSIYKSNGRKSFENRVLANLKTDTFGQGSSSLLSCWTQPSTEEIWSSEFYQQIETQPADHPEQLEVCAIYAPKKIHQTSSF